MAATTGGKMKTGRRDLLKNLGIGMAMLPADAGSAAAQDAQTAPRKGKPLDIADYQPKSMLHVHETNVERARFPVIDVHTHISTRGSSTDPVRPTVPLDDLIKVMDRRNIRTLVNLTGGVGSAVKNGVANFDEKYPGRFLQFTQPFYNRVSEPGYAKLQGDAIHQAHRDGARGLKILKSLGLTVRDENRKLIKVDDPRFDPMWEACGGLGIPVAIHVSDPAAFFTPIDRFNERWEELNNHPDWSFYGKDFPKNEEILEARNRVIARHPKTNFIVLHVGNYAENLGHVSGCLDRYPNMNVELAARIGELGRQPRTSRKFFEKYQDRILFGTDAIPNGHETPQQVFGDELYKIYYRFLETEDEYFDYAPAPVPPQGRWRIYGIGLPDGILRKVYHQNAERLLKFKI
jgi:predicted TIM-barrel fold metal-dependent hydrolase